MEAKGRQAISRRINSEIRRRQKAAIVCILLSVCFSNCRQAYGESEPKEPPPAPSETPSFYGKLDEINQQILQKDIELEKFNINFRRAINVQGRWRGPRYFLSQETNAAGTAAGLWLAVHTRYQPIHKRFIYELNAKGKLIRHINTPNRVALENAITPQLVGQCVGAYGSACEFGINLYHDYQAKKHGYDFKTALRHVTQIKAQMQALIKEREALIEEFSSKIPASHVQLARAQGEVLNDLCYLALAEYVKFHYNSRRYRFFQDSIYLMDVSRNLVGAAGSIVAMYATERRRPSASLPAGLGTLLSGAIVFGAPMATRLAGKLVADHEAKELSNLSATTESIDLDELQQDHKNLMTLAKEAHKDDPVSDRFITQLEQLEILNELNTQEHRTTFHMANRELRAQTRAAQENILTGTIVGGTKMVTGIGVTTAGYRYYHQAPQSNPLIFGTTIPYAVGATIGAAENVRIQLTGELQRRKLAKRKLLPGQILTDHMNKLDQIQRELDKSGGNNR